MVEDEAVTVQPPPTSTIFHQPPQSIPGVRAKLGPPVSRLAVRGYNHLKEVGEDGGGWWRLMPSLYNLHRPPPTSTTCFLVAPVAQLDRASASGAEGRGFESRLA